VKGLPASFLNPAQGRFDDSVHSGSRVLQHVFGDKAGQRSASAKGLSMASLTPEKRSVKALGCGCTPLYPPKADIVQHGGNVRFVPKADMAYSITSSASCWSCQGTFRPSVLAVLMLMTSSNFVGSSTGRSAGFAPFSMRAV
jgi:hypothetical protein